MKRNCLLTVLNMHCWPVQGCLHFHRRCVCRAAKPLAESWQRRWMIANLYFKYIFCANRNCRYSSGSNTDCNYM